jgi:spermidine synthase
MKNYDRAVYFSVVCLGVSAFVTQLLVLREFLAVFAGNELVLGLTLGNWLLLTGLGSFLGRTSGRWRDPLPWLVGGQVILALLPPVQLAAIRLMKQLFLPGLTLSLELAFLASLLLLLPYCLISGFSLILCAGRLSSHRLAGQVSAVYVLDSLGSIAGGFLFSFLLVFFATPFQSVALLLVLEFTAALYLCWTASRRGLAALVLGVLLLALGALGLTDLDQATARAMFPGQELLEYESTPYGTLAVVRQGQQLAVYANSVPLSASDDPAAAEEMVHYGLSQHPDPRTVLLVGGGLCGAPGEAGKYLVERIDYLELDPAVLELAGKLRPLDQDPRLQRMAGDARRLVRTTATTYEAILMDLPPPATAQLNRFYTVEFFSEVLRALRPGGVFSFGLGGAENYAGPQVRLLASAVYRSLSSVFPQVLVIPGERLFFIASERPLSYDIAARLQQRHIETQYVNADYLAARLTPDRLAAAREMVGAPAPLNRDFFPTSYYAHLRYWLTQFGSSLALPVLFLLGTTALISVLLAGSAQRAVPGALCATGFAGMGLEVVVLIGFQVCYGYVYQQLGLIATGFLAGAAGGAAWSSRRSADLRRLMLWLGGLLAGLALALAPILEGLHRWAGPPGLVPVAFVLLAGTVGFLAGAQFPLAARLTFRGAEETAGTLYALDLLGACTGALAISVFSLPLLGIAATCYVIGGIELLSVGALWLEQQAPDLSPVRPSVSLGRPLAFGLVLGALVTLGALILAADTSADLYALSCTPAYHWIVLGLLGWGILEAMGVIGRLRIPGGIWAGLGRTGRRLGRLSGVSPWRWVGFLFLAPVAFYPVFRCFFRVPYLFCHVCPRLCGFGYLRPYLVPGALIMNLEDRHWCHRVCPIGTLYHCQAGTREKARRRPRLLAWVAVAVLAFTAVAYVKLEWDLEAPPLTHNWYASLYKNRYAASGTVIALAVLLLVLGYRWRRAFCHALCPVGTFSELVLKLEKALPGEVGWEPSLQEKVNGSGAD